MERAECDNLADVIGTVLPGNVIDDLLTAFIAEVYVDIRHGDALGVQESLEQQLIFKRVEHGDAQRVRDN